MLEIPIPHPAPIPAVYASHCLLAQMSSGLLYRPLKISVEVPEDVAAFRKLCMLTPEEAIAYINSGPRSEDFHNEVVLLAKINTLPLDCYLNDEAGISQWSVFIVGTEYWLNSFPTEEEARKYMEGMQTYKAPVVEPADQIDD